MYNRDERFDCVGVIFPEKGERCVLTKDSLVRYVINKGLFPVIIIYRVL